MNAFLIQYERPTGELEVKPFDSLVDATAERLKLDRANSNPDLEIVAVASENLGHLRISHARYFSGRR